MSTELNVEAQSGYGPLLKGIVNDVQLLFRKELELAGAEVRRDAGTLGHIGARVGVAALLGLLVLGLLSLSVVHFLVWIFPDLPLWGSFAITALGFGAVAGLAAKSGLDTYKHAHLGPTHTIETMKENGQWLRAQL